MVWRAFNTNTPSRLTKERFHDQRKSYYYVILSIIEKPPKAGHQHDLLIYRKVPIPNKTVQCEFQTRIYSTNWSWSFRHLFHKLIFVVCPCFCRIQKTYNIYAPFLPFPCVSRCLICGFNLHVHTWLLISLFRYEVNSRYIVKLYISEMMYYTRKWIMGRVWWNELFTCIWSLSHTLF